MMDIGALTESTYYTLLSLTEPLHGYGVMQKVEEMSGGRIKMAAGTLYGALSNLLEKGYIAEVERETPSRKREYHLTSLGEKVLVGEIQRLEELVDNGRKILCGGEVQ